MTKLGLVGGIGPEATHMYYRGIIEGYGEVAGRENLPRLTIDSLSAFEVFALCADQRYDELCDYLLEAVNNLAAAGAEVGALTGNTPHIVFDELAERAPIPLISAVTATCRAAERRGLKKVGLLGTKFTMVNDFFRIPFDKAGIELVVPGEEDVEYIQDRIAGELEHGVVTDETRDGLVTIIESMVATDQIEQVILGCTELPLILDDTVSPVPCLDTARIHIEELVAAIS